MNVTEYVHTAKGTKSFNGDWTPKATTNWQDDILYRQQTK